jgi:hypothetical protein
LSRAAELDRATRSAIAKYPAILQDCTQGSGCGIISYDSSLSQYQSSFNSFTAYARSVAKTLSASKSRSTRKAASALSKSIGIADNVSKSGLGKLPSSTRVCQR